MSFFVSPISLTYKTPSSVVTPTFTNGWADDPDILDPDIETVIIGEIQDMTDRELMHLPEGWREKEPVWIGTTVKLNVGDLVWKTSDTRTVYQIQKSGNNSFDHLLSHGEYVALLVEES